MTPRVQIAITPEQAALIAAALQHAHTLVGAVSAGHAPAGATFVQVMTDPPCLVFALAAEAA